MKKSWNVGKITKHVKIQVDVDGSGSVEFPEFCVMMVKKMRESDIENEVRNRIINFLQRCSVFPLQYTFLREYLELINFCLYLIYKKYSQFYLIM